MKTIEEIKIVLLNSSEEDFLKELKNYDIFEYDKYGNDIVHYFINNYNDINVRFDKMMEVLLKKGLNIDTKQKTGNFQRSYLQLSVMNNIRNIFDFLIKNSADVNSIDKNGNTVLFNAVMNYFKDKENYTYYIEKLLIEGAAPKLKNNNGISAVKLANEIDNSDVKKFFKSINKK